MNSLETMKRIWIAALPAAAACGPGADRAAGPEVVTDTIGDTIVVRTLAGSVWGGDATLVPEVSIGELDGPEELLFGQIWSLAVDDDRNVYVFDRQEQAVRVFDADGEFQRKLGRKGQGPGELEAGEAMAVLPDGRVLVRDPGNMRVQVFGPGPGEEEAWSYNPGDWWIMTPLWTDREGRTYLIAPDLSHPTESSTMILIVLEPDGTPADTLPTPHAGFEGTYVRAEREGMSVSYGVRFTPRAFYTVHPSGGILSGISDRYRIDLRTTEGVFRIERIYEPVRVSGAEADHARAQTERNIRRSLPGWTWDGPSIPDTKPAFHDLYAGRDGRIWVLVSTAGYSVENEDHDPEDPSSIPVHWHEPLRFDVFEPDGSYLGAVNPPEGFSSTRPAPVFGGDHVWAVTSDDLGVQRVVRYRIEINSER